MAVSQRPLAARRSGTVPQAHAPGLGLRGAAPLLRPRRPSHALPSPLAPRASLIPASPPPPAATSPAAASVPLSNGGLGGPAAGAGVLPRPPTGPITGAALGELVRKFKRLQNGSDIRGIALEGVPNEPVTLSAGAVFFIGVAFARWLRSKGHAAPKVSVGRDPRLSGPLLESAFAAGLIHGGAAAVHLFGLATTPAMFYSIVLSGGASKGPASPAFFSTAASVASAAKRAAPLSADGAGSPPSSAAGGSAGTNTMLPPPPVPPAAELAAQPYTGAVMLTASHLPYNANGLKFFTAAGGLDKPDIAELLQSAAAAAAEAGVNIGDPVSEQSHLLAVALSLDPSRLARLPFLPTYSASLRDLIKRGVNSPANYHFPLLGCHVVVDAGNGSGGFFAEQVLAPLGADTSGSVFLDPDGTFPNHPPNPEHPAAMASGAAAVKASGAELGIVFDTDVDRSAIVDASGREINSNRFIALMSAVVLRQHPGTTIVTDSVTSNGLADFIAALGGKHMRYKRGYKNVIGAGVRLNAQGEDCALMMETSGHGALRENFFLDDGAYLAVKAIIEHVRRKQEGAAGGLAELLAGLAEPAESREWRVRIQHADFKAVGGRVLAAFHDWVAAAAQAQAQGHDGGHEGGGGSGVVPAAPATWSLESVNHEGWRVNMDEGQGRRGWLLLRQSLHDPLLVLNCESELPGGAEAAAGRVAAWLRAGGAGAELPLDLGALGQLGAAGAAGAAK
ncbi:hypothetical protein HYH02_000569 [Chlamydomonas schloesseri]|uniref:phosphoglucomutase (alpha-D-glucose-1,6-bisphosphate-dependent) n=1 Tax=Chlamydomonas schloesseri TaxID=2026947 RepID=A0A836BCR1_9CHLO|nr:hypothetical protein HYH02_000569 [Chlamydomonas schloesseri]|eukprot:KAG2454732.1 hypothetical protein HYH02_000569 [Chlamydomonas schloesseri]